MAPSGGRSLTKNRGAKTAKTYVMNRPLSTGVTSGDIVMIAWGANWQPRRSVDPWSSGVFVCAQYDKEARA